MPDNVTNQLLLEHLKAIQAKLATMDDQINELHADVRGLKSHMPGFLPSEIARDSTIATMQERPDRIERRLELPG